MAVTSSTTAVAFFVNITSQLMPVRAFGIFAGVIVLVNYILVVLFFPPTIIFYERYIEGKITKCSQALFGCPRFENVETESEPNPDSKKFKGLEHFFRTTWNTNIRKFRYLIVFIVTIWTCFAGFLTTKISPLTKEEDFLPPDHAVRRGGVIINKFVKSTTAKTDV